MVNVIYPNRTVKMHLYEVCAMADICVQTLLNMTIKEIKIMCACRLSNKNRQIVRIEDV